MESLINPTPEYIRRIESSKDFLNNPKLVINQDFDSLFRQSKSREECISWFCDILNKFNFKNSKQLSNKFYDWRSSISNEEFNKITRKLIWNKIPNHIEELNKKISKWYKDNTIETWNFGVLTSSYVKDYPFLSKYI